MSNSTSTSNNIIIREASSILISFFLAIILTLLLYRWVAKLGPPPGAEAELELDDAPATHTPEQEVNH